LEIATLGPPAYNEPVRTAPIGNFLGVVLALLPLISQIRKLSLAVWGYAIWITVSCFQTFVNTIIWRDNVNIVAPVWCDIVSKLQIGTGVGTRACALVICIRLFIITRLRRSTETAKQRRTTMIYELLLIVGLPVLIMALFIIVQPTRFEIVEEEGCAPDVYSYVGYIIGYGSSVISSAMCAILAPLTLRIFLRHRKEMNEFLSKSRDITHSKYNRLMVIACLDTLFNLPVLLTITIVNICQGKESALNYPYISWKNVHNNEGGNVPGVSLSSIIQTPAGEWGTDRWNIFNLKWNEWIYVLHATTFFCVFGTTPEMRQYYQSAFWFIPKRLGYERPRASEVETISDVAFNSRPGQQTETRFTASNGQASLSFLEAAIEKKHDSFGGYSG